MNSYSLHVNLARVKESDIDLRDYEEQINNSINYYNNICRDVANPKSMELITINPKSFIIVLNSQNELMNPGKAVRLLSQKLIECIPQLEASISNKQLFRIEVLETGDFARGYSKYQAINEQITDFELLAGILSFVLKKTDDNTSKSSEYKTKKQALIRIKEIAWEAGLIIK